MSRPPLRTGGWSFQPWPADAPAPWLWTPAERRRLRFWQLCYWIGVLNEG